MTIYHSGEDDIFDLQRMPRKTGSATSTDHLPPQHLPRRYGENVQPVVFMDGPIIYTDDHPFCFVDPTCPCHEDQEAITLVNSWVEQGLMTPQEATEFIKGRTF